MASKSASCCGISQSTSPARSSGATRARMCERNWRTLAAHQEAEESKDHRRDDLAADRVARRQEEDQQQQDEAVLLEDRAPLPAHAWRQEGEQHFRPVEGWDREQVEDHQHE